jgi:hypothetical protein
MTHQPIPVDAQRAGPSYYTYFHTEARHALPGYTLWRRPAYVVSGATLFGEATAIYHYDTRLDALNAVRRLSAVQGECGVLVGVA